jgi:hypothetical protein
MTYVMSTVRYDIRYAHMGDIRTYVAQICTGRRLVQRRGRFQYNNVLCSSTRRTQRYAAQDPTQGGNFEDARDVCEQAGRSLWGGSEGVNNF